MRGHPGGEGQGRAAVEESANGGSGGDVIGHEHQVTRFAADIPDPFVRP
jgi:hypothetical protein